MADADALIDAARHGRLADVAALLADGAAVNAWTIDGATALHVACENGQRCNDALPVVGDE